MRTIFAALKLILFSISTVFCYLLGILGSLLSLLGFKGRFWTTFSLKIWGKLSCFILGIKVSVKGTAPVPPFFLVSNHLSYVDIMMLLSQVRGVFVAKNEVSNWPLFGFMTKTLGMIFINREKRTDVKRVNDLISKNITPNQGVLLFPESTTSEGTQILPFKSALLAYPATKNFAVHYATVYYETPKNEIHACDSVCWWGDIDFLTHFFRLLKLKRIYGTIHFGDFPVIENDRKLLATKLYQNVSSQFKQVISKQDFDKRNQSKTKS